LARLRAYHWPGNIRELRNIMERAQILAGGGEIQARHILLPVAKGAASMSGDEPMDLNIEAHEARLIAIALRRAGGNKTQAAQLLGLTRRALYSRMERLEIPIDG
jgi:two-component system response regulator AtoC